MAAENGSTTKSSFVEIGSDDSEDDLPPEWEVRATDEGRLYYAK